MQEDERDDLRLMSDGLSRGFTNPFRQQAAEVAATGLCQAPPLGCGLVATAFRDEISVREYRITGMCQTCQDAVYALAEEWEEQGMMEDDLGFDPNDPIFTAEDPIEYYDDADLRDYDDANEPVEWNEREVVINVPLVLNDPWATDLPDPAEFDEPPF